VPRLWTALLLGRRELVRGLDAGWVAVVFQACEDRDAALASEAIALLSELTDPAARDAVCQRFLDRNDDEARRAALEGGYLPRDPAKRALFLFLTEQWERYEALDFDRRLLATIHEAADAGLRQRITEKLRAAGRTDYLAVLAGQDFRSRAGRMSAAESEVLVRLLAGNREWDRLWPLVFELDLTSSVRIVRLLKQAGGPPRATPIVPPSTGLWSWQRRKSPMRRPAQATPQPPSGVLAFGSPDASTTSPSRRGGR